MPFVAAIALSAFLLFSLELLAGRLLLPVFGGSPAVWTTALVFFTGALLVGYAYADVVASRLSRATGTRLQLLLVALALVLTLLAPANVATTRVTGLPEAANVLLALAVICGPAALLLATTTPLLSAWFSRTDRDPWWLYAASNSASFAALLCYPLLVQPLIGLTGQRTLLLAGLAVYGGLVAATALVGRSSAAPTEGQDRPDHTPPERLTAGRQLRWLLAAAIPAGLLSATTNFITTDVVAAPLLWIGPLAAYLASFVVAFSNRGKSLVGWAQIVVPGAAALMIVPFAIPVGWPLLPLIAVELASLFVLATAIHGRLYADRPDERQLTRFYLVLSTGGVAGTAFVALVAPVIFDAIYEYPLLVVAAPLALAVVPRAAHVGLNAAKRLIEPWPLLGRVAAFALVAGLLWAALFIQDSAIAVPVAAIFILAGALVTLSIRPIVTAVLMGGFAVLLLVVTFSNPLHRERTFFGVLEVRATAMEHLLYSGTTLHGVQVLDFRRTEATAYYLPTGPLGDCFDDLRSRTATAQSTGARIAVVGLGAGVMATYAQPTDELTFIEIDAADARIAQEPQFFTFLADAPVQPRVVIGDGRLELEALTPRSFDLLVLDAFSSDTVPAHLLTAEAIQTYMEVLRPTGIVCIHLSNRHYDLPPSVVSTARSVGLAGAELAGQPSEEEVEWLGAQKSLWTVVGQPADIARFVVLGWKDTPPGLVLTDDDSDLTRLLLTGFRQP